MLPNAPTPDAFDALDLDGPALRAAAAAIGGAPAARIRVGSLPVFHVGEDVLKLYPPCYADEGHHEARWLSALAGKLPIETPRLRDQGERDGWRYVKMSRLSGVAADRRWDQLSRADQIALSEQLGEVLAALHGLSLPETLGLAPWPAFVAAQRAGAAARQARLGLPAALVAQIDPLLDTLAWPAAPQVGLHTEIMRAHLFVSDVRGRPRLSGLLDFEPATRGAAGYELASVGLFWSCGEPALLRAVLRGYGVPAADQDRGLSIEMLRWALLHRYSNLPWYLRRMPPPQPPADLEALADHFFGLSSR